MRSPHKVVLCQVRGLPGARGGNGQVASPVLAPVPPTKPTNFCSAVTNPCCWTFRQSPALTVGGGPTASAVPTQSHHKLSSGASCICLCVPAPHPRLPLPTVLLRPLQWLPSVLRIEPRLPHLVEGPRPQLLGSSEKPGVQPSWAVRKASQRRGHIS